MCFVIKYTVLNCINIFFIDNGIKYNSKTNPAELIAGQVTVQSEKESLLSKKLRKLEKKDRSKYSSVEIKQYVLHWETVVCSICNILELKLNMILPKVHLYLKKVLLSS